MRLKSICIGPSFSILVKAGPTSSKLWITPRTTLKNLIPSRICCQQNCTSLLQNCLKKTTLALKTTKITGVFWIPSSWGWLTSSSRKARISKPKCTTNSACTLELSMTKVQDTLANAINSTKTTVSRSNKKRSLSISFNEMLPRSCSYLMALSKTAIDWRDNK